MSAARTHVLDNLSPERAKHSLAVAEEMGRVAKQYGLDKNQAAFAGLMHDIGKELPFANMVELVRAHDPVWWRDLPENCRHEIYLHDPAGAVLAKRLFPGLDAETLSAIRGHMLNDPDLPTLTRVLRVADIVRPVADYPGRQVLEHLLHAGELNMANLVLDAFSYRYFTQAGLPIWPTLLEHHAELKRRLGPIPDSIAALLKN